MSKNIQPIFILSDNTQRSSGKQAQNDNIMVAKAVAETVRTTLGPKGMDKLLVDNNGEITITNDGVTILKEMQVTHPVAKLMVEVAKTQEEEVGDGTTSAVILAGELLKKAEHLLEQGVHPSVLARGYQLASLKAQEIMKELSEPLVEEHLKKIAMTAMTGKGAENNKEELAKLVKEAAEIVKNLEDVRIKKIVGKGKEESSLLRGIVLDKEIVHPSMPKMLVDAKIALLNFPLEIRSTEIDAKIQITDPTQLNIYLSQEEQTIKEMVNKIVASGTKVVFCQKGIDDLAQHFLAKHGILAVRRIKKDDLEALAKATGGKIVNHWGELTEEDLGFSGKVKEEIIKEEKSLFVEKCLNPKTVTLLICGHTEHVAEETKRAVVDALGDVIACSKEKKVLAGAGAVEMELSNQLRIYSQSLEGRNQLAVTAFAEAVEIIPKTLAENAGLDAINILASLKTAHIQGQKWAGLDVFSGKVMDAWKEGILEPLKVKSQALASATEVTELILRVDDVILSNDAQASQKLLKEVSK